MSIIKRGMIYLVIVAYLCACGHAPVTSESQRIVSKEKRARTGTMGVLALSAPQGELEVEAWGVAHGAAHGAVKGMGEGAEWGALLPVAACISGIPICVIIIMVAPEIAISVEVISTVTGVVIGTAIGTTIGTVAGAVQSIPEDKAGEMEARLKAILAEDHPHEKLRFSVINGAAKLGVQDVSEIAAGTPAVSGQGIDYWQLSGAKIDTILKVGLVSVSLSGSGGTDPDIFLNFSAVARLEDAKHKVELSRHNVTCQTEPRKFSEWNADGGSIIKEDIERAYRSLGQSIVNEIFLIESAKGESKRC